MTFDSLTFAVFLAIVFPAYVLLRSWNGRKTYCSPRGCVFYGSWNPFFLILLAFTTVFRLVGGATHPCGDRRHHAATLVLGIDHREPVAARLFQVRAVLCQHRNQWLALVGVTYNPSTSASCCRSGISFYTFESIFHIVDVTKKRITPTKICVTMDCS